MYLYDYSSKYLFLNASQYVYTITMYHEYRLLWYTYSFVRYFTMTPYNMMSYACMSQFAVLVNYTRTNLSSSIHFRLLLTFETKQMHTHSEALCPSLWVKVNLVRDTYTVKNICER